MTTVAHAQLQAPTPGEAGRLVLGAACALASYSAECLVIGVHGSFVHPPPVAYVFGAVLLISGFICLGTALTISFRSEGRPLVYKQVVGIRRGLGIAFSAIRRPLSPSYLQVASITLGWSGRAVLRALAALLFLAAVSLVFALTAI